MLVCALIVLASTCLLQSAVGKESDISRKALERMYLSFVVRLALPSYSDIPSCTHVFWTTAEAADALFFKLKAKLLLYLSAIEVEKLPRVCVYLRGPWWHVAGLESDLQSLLPSIVD